MRKISLIIIVFLLMFSSASSSSFAANDISVIVNGEKVVFNDQKPVIISSRVLVPARAVFEKMGAMVNWFASEQKITIENDDVSITLFIDDVNVTMFQKIFNKKYTAVNDIAPTLISGRTMIPLNIVATALGADVTWNGTTRTVDIKEAQKNISDIDLLPFSIGDIQLRFFESENDLIQKLGEPSRIDSSQYGFKWYVYNNDYANYIQVGLLNSKIVALYSNSPQFDYRGIKSGSSCSAAADILQAEGAPDSKKLFGEERLTKVVVYNDAIGNSVDAILIMLKDAAKGELNFSEDVLRAFERQIFDFSNVIRIKNGLSVMEWDEQAATSARKHSKDMGDRNYFSHENLDGKSPFDRMNMEGITYHLAAENISCGQSDAFDSYSDWINSQGHRDNILNGNLEKLGVGVAINGDVIYYTQNFYTD